MYIFIWFLKQFFFLNQCFFNFEIEFILFFLKGYLYVEFGSLIIEFRILKIFGDNIGWLYVRDQQILRVEYVEGIQSYLIINVNIDLDKDVILYILLNMIVVGTILNLRG